MLMTISAFLPALLGAAITIGMVIFFFWWAPKASTLSGRYRCARQMLWLVMVLSLVLVAVWILGNRGYWFTFAVVLSLYAQVQLLLEMRRCRKRMAKIDAA